MKLTTAATTTKTTKTGTITVADLRKKFRIPAEAKVALIIADGIPGETDAIIEVTHVIEAAK